MGQRDISFRADALLNGMNRKYRCMDRYEHYDPALPLENAPIRHMPTGKTHASKTDLNK
jgi:hypothetical protein